MGCYMGSVSLVWPTAMEIKMKTNSWWLPVEGSREEEEEEEEGGGGGGRRRRRREEESAAMAEEEEGALCLSSLWGVGFKGWGMAATVGGRVGGEG